MPSRWSRWSPLTGLVFVILVILGGPIAQGNTPSSKASGEAVIAFYEAHHSRERAGAILLTLAFIFLLFFAGTLRAYLRRSAASEAYSAVMLAGATVLLAGQTAAAGINYALGDAPSLISPAAAQALNVLAGGLILTAAAGFCVFGIASGLAILRSGRLPKWLGWLAIAIGIFVLTPAEGIAFLALVIWIVIVSILLVRRGPEIEPAAAAGAPPAAA